jgi:predicted dehydrogenase
MSTNGIFRFLLSGPGLIGKQHAQLILRHPNAVLSAVVAPNTPDNRSFASQVEANRYSNIESALEHEYIDAAIVSSPNSFHFEQAITCIKNNIPVLVEKPLTSDLDTAKALMEKSEALAVPVLVGHHRTYSPLLSEARTFLQSKDFGRLVTVHGSALFFKPTRYFEDGPWRRQPGGGPILINLIHEIGILRFLCGEIKAVSAISSNGIRDFEVEDTAAIIFGFENGAIGTFILSDAAASNKSWEMTSGENTAYPWFPKDNCYHFAGTNGSLDFPSMASRTYPSAQVPSWWSSFAQAEISVPRRNPLELQFEHFINVLRGRERPRVPARDGYQNMAVIEAIQASIASNTIAAVLSPCRLNG